MQIEMPDPKYKPGEKIWIIVWDSDKKKLGFVQEKIEFYAMSYNLVVEEPKKKKGQKEKAEEYRKLLYHLESVPLVPHKETDLFATEVDARNHILKQLT